jgi:hypothetical protein
VVHRGWCLRSRCPSLSPPVCRAEVKVPLLEPRAPRERHVAVSARAPPSRGNPLCISPAWSVVLLAASGCLVEG